MMKGASAASAVVLASLFCTAARAQDASNPCTAVAGVYTIAGELQRRAQAEELKAPLPLSSGWFRRAPRIVTRTVAISPANRQRKEIGVGEAVVLSVQPSPKTSLSWSIAGEGNSGPGTLSAETGNPVTFAAPERASHTTVTVTMGDTMLTVEFNVIEPNGAFIEQEPGSLVSHERGIPSVGFCGAIFVTPANVSFRNVEIFEGDAVATATNYFAYENEQLHDPTDRWVPMYAHFDGKGSLFGIDLIHGDADNHAPYEAGQFTWRIPWFFRVAGGEKKQFATMEHVKTIDSKGSLTLSKGGTRVTKKVKARSSGYWP
jgi:hypothetical protein